MSGEEEANPEALTIRIRDQVKRENDTVKIGSRFWCPKSHLFVRISYCLFSLFFLLYVPTQ